MVKKNKFKKAYLQLETLDKLISVFNSVDISYECSRYSVGTLEQIRDIVEDYKTEIVNYSEEDPGIENNYITNMCNSIDPYDFDTYCFLADLKAVRGEIYDILYEYAI